MPLKKKKTPRGSPKNQKHICLEVAALKTSCWEGIAPLIHSFRIWQDPFRGSPHILVLAEAYNAWDGQPAIGNTCLCHDDGGVKLKKKTVQN